MNNLATAWKTDRGPRPDNEDSCAILSRDDLGGHADGLLVVADGMGGRASGATASGVAVTAVWRAFVAGLQPDCDLEALLAGSLRAANTAVVREAGTRPELKGMGTTCLAAAIRGDRLITAHVGDSRGYLLRGDRLLRLTEDHSIVAEKVRAGEMTEDQARRSRFRNVITRAIGLDDAVEPEVGGTDLRPGDVVILCSDGLSGPVREPEIARIVGSSPTVDDACDGLVRAALKNGGSDNVTVAIAAYRRQAAAPSGSPGREGIGRRLARALAPGLLGLAVGLSLGLYAEKIPLLEKIVPAPMPAVRAPEPEMAGFEYGIPASLLYTPVQGHVLRLSKGHLYVVDAKGQLTKVDTTGRVLQVFPAGSAFEEQMKSQSAGFALDRQGNLYVSEPENKRIVKYSSDGALLSAIGAGQLVGPEAIVVDRGGDIYVIDGGRLKAIRVK